MESVTRSQGYKVAYEHFEDLINGLLRDREKQNYDVVDGIERVFRYFESGRLKAEKAEENIKKYQDEP